MPEKQSENYGNRHHKDPRYHSKEWRKDRKAFLLENPICKGPDSICEKKGLVSEAKVMDHIIPVRKGGDFWDWANRQGLCKSCNAIKTAKDR